MVRFELTFGGEGVVEGGEKTGERAKRKKEGEHGAELEHRELMNGSGRIGSLESEYWGVLISIPARGRVVPCSVSLLYMMRAQ